MNSNNIASAFKEKAQHYQQQQKPIPTSYTKQYYARKMKEFRDRNPTYYFIEINGKAYVFQNKNKIQRIKSKYLNTLTDPIYL